MNGQQIKKAAETLEGLAAQLEEAQSTITKIASERDAVTAERDTLKGEVAQRKIASAEETKNRGTLAKRAAAALLQSGLVSTPQRADAFANEVLDHNKALVALHKFAEHASKAPKVASVVDDPQGTAVAESADAVWDRHATAYLPQGA